MEAEPQARYLIDPYADWARSEGVPVHTGFGLLAAAAQLDADRLGEQGEAVCGRRCPARQAGSSRPVGETAFLATSARADLGQLDHAGAMQLAEVVAGQRLADAQLAAEFHGGERGPGQQRQHPQPQRVSQDPQPGQLVFPGILRVHTTTVGRPAPYRQRIL